MTTSKWWAIYVLIQLASAILTVPGWVICLWPPFAKLTWLWWNSDDGAVGKSWFEQYVWLAWRNSVSNLRRIYGVSGPGRPLLYHWRTSTPADIKSGWYYKIGWESGPPYYPVFSFGSGRGY
jgi:hypothetical protein